MQHGSSKSSGPVVPEPTHAERSRTLVRKGGQSTISTMSAHQQGYPFGSVMPYADDEQGEPLLLISTMAMHTQNIEADSRCTLLIMEQGVGDMLGAGRVSLIGDARRVESSDLPRARERYLASQPAAAQWIEFSDFHMYRIHLIDVYFVGGFGVMGWVTAEQYREAEPDPLLSVSADIIQHMNTDHAESLAALAKETEHADIQSAALTAVDRLGFHLRVQTGEGPRGGRINFPNEVRTADECRQAFVELVKAARGG